MILKKTFRETWGIQLAYFLVLELMLLVAVLWWGDLRDVLAEISRLGFLGILGKLIPFDFLKKPFLSLVNPAERYPSYIALQHFFKGVDIMGIAGALLLGTFVVAREKENRTLELLLSLPASRGRILLEKTLVPALGLAAGIFLSSLSLLALSPLVKESLQAGPLLLCSLHATMVVYFFLALTVFVSTFFRTQAGTAFTVGLFIAVQFALYFVQKVRVISFFKFSDFDVYFPMLSGKAGLPFVSLEIPLLAGTILLYLAAHYRFTKGDL